MTTVVVNQADLVQWLDLWKVARVDVNTLEPDQRDEVLAWLEGLGVPTKCCIPWLVVTQSGYDERYRVHVSVKVEGRHGTYIDHAAGRMHSEPLVLAVESFPGFLSGLDHKEP